MMRKYFSNFQKYVHFRNCNPQRTFKRPKSYVPREITSSKSYALPITLSVGALVSLWLFQKRAQSSSLTQCESNSSSSAYITKNFVADAAEIAAPAVVNIVTTIESFAMQGASAGSGFIISKDGFIVTNAHVVSQSSNGKVLITMWDGTKLSGYVHSYDEKSDIALVKVSAGDLTDDLPTVTLGNSSNLRVGEFVVALGSPLQLSNTVTFGIVSAVARHATELGLARSRAEYIQTDAAINVGNSGGPLVNINGEVIGINTMKVNASGISFAIPIDTAVQVIKQLQKFKKVTRPYIGMKLANYYSTDNGSSSSSSNTQNGHNNSFGHFFRRAPSRVPSGKLGGTPRVIVLDVERNSPASQSGLQSGDIILEVDGKPVKGVRDILDAIGLEVGKVMEITVSRSYGKGEYSTNEGDLIKLRIKSAPETNY